MDLNRRPRLKGGGESLLPTLCILIQTIHRVTQEGGLWEAVWAVSWLFPSPLDGGAAGTCSLTTVGVAVRDGLSCRKVAQAGSGGTGRGWVVVSWKELRAGWS